MQVNDYVSFWSAMAVAPALALGFCLLYLEKKTGYKENILSQVKLVTVTALMALPFSALIVNWIMGTFFNPVDHPWFIMNEVNDPAIIHSQVSEFDQKCESYREARHVLNNIFDYGIASMFGLGFVYLFGMSIFSMFEKDSSKTDVQK